MKIIFPILFIIISIVLFIMMVNPLYKDVSALRADIAVYNSALDNSTELQKTQDSLLGVYKSIKQSDKDRLGNFLPSSVNNIQFILEIERIANLHRMPIKDIKFETAKKVVTPAAASIVASEVSKDNRPYGVFPLEFATEGKYNEFVLFLKDLELNLRMIDIKSISFSTSESNSRITTEGVDPDVYRYTVKVETYWLK